MFAFSKIFLSTLLSWNPSFDQILRIWVEVIVGRGLHEVNVQILAKLWVRQIQLLVSDLLSDDMEHLEVCIPKLYLGSNLQVDQVVLNAI